MSHNGHAAPNQYEIRIAGHLDPERAIWFGELVRLEERDKVGGDLEREEIQ